MPVKRDDLPTRGVADLVPIPDHTPFKLPYRIVGGNDFEVIPERECDRRASLEVQHDTLVDWRKGHILRMGGETQTRRDEWLTRQATEWQPQPVEEFVNRRFRRPDTQGESSS